MGEVSAGPLVGRRPGPRLAGGVAEDGVHAPANARDTYGVAYAQLVVPLAQAVQEQQAEIATLKAQAAADHATLLALQAQLTRLLGEGTRAPQ